MTLLISLGIAAVITMLLLFQVWLGSWRFAVLSLMTPLVAVAGAFLAARIAGDTLSLGSWFGAFAVFGLAMRNGLLLVSSYRRREREAGESPSYAFVLDGSGERLVPVAMTAVATLLISLTFIAFGSRPGQELAYPLAIAVFGGVLAGTASTLFAVPVMYSRLAGFHVYRRESIQVDVGERTAPEKTVEKPRERNRCDAQSRDRPGPGRARSRALGLRGIVGEPSSGGARQGHEARRRWRSDHADAGRRKAHRRQDRQGLQ
jgi:predicted RND superfamily exporter protein